MVVDCDLDSSTATETGTPTPSEIQALIKEAKRHQRLRLGFIALAFVAVAIVVSALFFVGGNSRPSPTATKHPEVRIPTVPSATCRADQLVIQYKGAQGAAGNIVSAFWIANTSGSSCSLRSTVTANLLNGSGATQLSASTTLNTPIFLAANTKMPAGNFVPTGDSLAAVGLRWPTIAMGALMMGSTSGYCPQALFSPAAVRIEFKGIAPITVSQFIATSMPSQPLSLCGTQFWIDGVSPLSG
jgi:hypothetical protein